MDRWMTRQAPIGPAHPVVAPEPTMPPLVGISPRRLLLAVALVAIAWGVISFGRQVAAASAAAGHADDLRAANAALAQEVAGLQHEMELVGDPRYIEQQARAYRLGSSSEIAFALAPNAPSLSPDSPGSASNRLGAVVDSRSPLDAWLEVLFGPEE